VISSREESGVVNQNWLVNIFFFVLLSVILYLAFLIISPFLYALVWAAILAMVVYPAYLYLLKLLRGRETAAALIVTVLITLLIVFPAMRISVFLSEEVVDLAVTLRTYMESNEFESWKGNPWVKDFMKLWERVSSELGALNIDLRKAAVQGVQISSTFLASQIRDVAQNVFAFAVNFTIALFSFFFLLRDGKDFSVKIRALLPMDREHKEHLFQNIANALFGVIHGSLITAMAQGLLAGLAYWFLGVPFAILLGVATAFLALMPIGGSGLIWFPTSVYLMIQGSYIKGVILLAWGIGIVGTIDNILKPLLIGSRLRLPTLVLFFSILGGLRLFGILGLILGPVLFALLAALLDLYMKDYVTSDAPR
jgi:predicted PurR-regulated permease PerM